MRLSDGCKNGNKNEYRGMRCTDRTGSCHEGNQRSKEKRTSDATRQGSNESDNHQPNTNWARGHLSGIPLLVPHCSGTGGRRDVAQRLRGVHSRGSGLEKHGGVWSTPLVEQVELVTIGGVSEHSILPEKLGHVVVLDEVGDRLAGILDLLITVTKGSECD